jgi:hypothetical protein
MSPNVLLISSQKKKEGATLVENRIAPDQGVAKQGYVLCRV